MLCALVKLKTLNLKKFCCTLWCFSKFFSHDLFAISTKKPSNLLLPSNFKRETLKKVWGRFFPVSFIHDELSNSRRKYPPWSRTHESEKMLPKTFSPLGLHLTGVIRQRYAF